jgi:Predicted acetyltransferase involved in intracellular survival and related acetyltransferases
MEIRLAKSEEMDAIYMMGYDTWSDDASEQPYLEACRASKKHAIGKWYVLSDGEKLISSLIVYEFGFGMPPGYCGIGSIATDPQMRRKGYANKLIAEVCSILRGRCKGIYLHADINSLFYERLGFSVAADGSAKCMMLRFSDSEQLPAEIPAYF